jgi:hypothetical protein
MSIEETVMPRGHCKIGSKMYELFQKSSQNSIAAEAEKRCAVTRASRAEWREIARQAEEARMEFERARCEYIEHVVGCKACEWDVLAYSYLNLLEHAGSSAMLAEIA